MAGSKAVGYLIDESEPGTYLTDVGWGRKRQDSFLYSEVGAMKSQPMTYPANLNCGFTKLNLDG